MLIPNTVAALLSKGERLGPSKENLWFFFFDKMLKSP